MGIEQNIEEWSFETDIVVVGSGGCGLTAALAAAEGGVEAFVLEKQSRPWSNTARSYGMIPAAGTKFQRAAGINESPEDFANDIFAKNHHASDPDMTLHLAKSVVTLVEWLIDDVGANLLFVDDFTYPGHSTKRMHAPPNRTGAELHADLRRAVQSNPNIELVNDAPVSGLIVDENNAVLGVIVDRGTQQERVKAKKVILACNGFAGNEEMVKQYIPAMANALYFGGEGNTGEGILWGMELGGEVAFMDAYQAHGSVATPHEVLITYALIAEGGFQVNKHGKRFGTEDQGYSERALEVLDQPSGLAWDIYDDRLHHLGMTFEDYRNAYEAGAIKSSDTVEGLAEAFSLPANQLALTLASYHAAADGKQKDVLGRKDCVRLEPPFYGVKVTGALFHTQGGLKVDFNARVLKEDGTVIPNLYAGGGVAAGVSGHGPDGYLSGNGLLTALGYGMLAGRDAARSINEGN